MKPTQYKFRPEIQLPRTTLQQLITYPDLQRRVNNQQYQLSGVHNLIVQLRKETIQQLREQFINNNNNVNLNQFMWLISNSLMVRNASFKQKSIEQEFYQYEVQYEIVKVFEQIDIDNSQSISWEQYIEYITSSSLMEINQNNQQQLAALTQQQKKTKQLNFSHKQKTIFRKNGIRKIIQLQKLNMLVIVQKKSDLLTFLTINGGILNKPFQLNGVDHSKVLSIDYSQQDRMFGVLMNTHNVIFVEDGEMQKVHAQNIFSGNEIQIIYLKRHKVWLLQSLDHSIQIFNPKKGRKKPQQQKRTTIKFKPHPQQLIGIRQLQNPLSILTASRNGSIKIWSLTINQLLIQLSPCKQDDFSQCKSIKGFQVYNNQQTTYLICWLFSPEISVWLPSSSLTKPYIGKLKGHIGIVQQAKFLTNFPIVVSIDNKNSIRVWDISKMQCIQNWKMQTPFSAKISVLKSAPYVMIYDKLIQFYKSTKQSNLIEFKSQIKSTLAITKVKQQIQTKMNHTVVVQPKKTKLDKKTRIRGSTVIPQRKKQDQFESEGQDLGQYIKDNITVVLDVLYDNYIDCLIILTVETLAIISINTGKILNKVYTQDKNEKFLAMCLKQNRRLFLANNLGEVDCLKTEDCSRLYRLIPFKDIVENSKNLIQKQQQMQKQLNKGPRLKTQKMSKQSDIDKDNDYQIFGMNYNPYNGVLTIIGQSQSNSAVITYDNFSVQPFKKKQVIFNQINLCTFAFSPKFNVFFIGSNQPEIITIWDFHNFVIIKSIHMPEPIINFSLECQRYNLLTIIEAHGVRILRVSPIQVKNMTKISDNNLIVTQLYINSDKRIHKGNINYANIDVNKRKIKQHRVKFNDQQQKNSKQRQVQQIGDTQKLQLYLLSGLNIVNMSLQELKDELTLSLEPSHNQKANITKQLKKINVSTHACPLPKKSISIYELQKQVLTNTKNTIILGRVNDLIFYQSNIGVIYLYKPSEKKTWAKMSLPKCQIIQWQICYNLADKIIDRLKKAQKVSRQIYAYKKRQDIDQYKLEHLRMAFIMNKYFDQQDMNILRNYFYNKQKLKKNARLADKQIHDALKLLEIKEKIDIANKFNSQINFFQQKFQQKHKRNKSAQKRLELQKNIKKTVDNIKERKLQQGQMINTRVQSSKSQKLKLQVKSEYNSYKARSTSLNKFTETQPKKRLSSTSGFKIRNTASSINKMYCQHTKQIKNFLNKIGILNNKIKSLKL